MSRVLASRLGSEGITVNTLACGPFQSKMMKETLEKFEESIVGGLPLGRIGTPEDVAGVCLFLSSRAGAYTTGYVDAGRGEFGVADVVCTVLLSRSTVDLSSRQSCNRRLGKVKLYRLMDE